MVDMKYVFLCGLLIIFQIYYVRNTEIYDINMKGFNKNEAENDKYIDITDLKFKKIAKKHFVLDGVVVIKDDIPDDLRVFILTARKIGGTFVDQPAASLNNLDACVEFYKDKVSVPYFLKHSDFPYVCPFPKGTYHIFNLSASPESLPKYIPYGDWKVTIQWKVVGRIIFSTLGFFDVHAVYT